MRVIPEFDELHVVSDLHLGGGEPRKQIFKKEQGTAFENLVDCLLKRHHASKQALVVNGDLVDFLAEPDATYFDPAGAAGKLDRIVHDPSFVPVWRSLRAFVKTPNASKSSNRRLIITLGNHDLELALPWVREQLLQELSGGDDRARERITLAFDEDGYRCRVGAADVLCTHGNDVDPWNVTDFEMLRRLGGESGRGSNGSQWVPNAGTKLVIDVMNAVKATYPFVDLLKPETEGVIPTLLVLDPSLAAKVGDLIPVGARRAWDSLRMATGFLSEEEATRLLETNRVKPTDVLGQMLGETFEDVDRKQGIYDLEMLLLRAERWLQQGVEPLQLLGTAEQPEYLGIMGAIWNLVRRKGKSEVLREALERLSTDQSFNIRTADATYAAYNRTLDMDIDFVVTGHTHLERALPLRGIGRYYYNSGTWARLIQLTEATLTSPVSFARAFDAFGDKHRGMAALDRADGLVLLKPSVVSLWSAGGIVHGELRHVDGARLERVEGSHFSRG
jgi:UDP-2,3-diacylglucosamine pyrophosphatase LpxH